MVFQKVTQNRVFQNMIDQIQEAILAEKFKTGDKLPSERELCESFNASRGSLREALRVLEQKGLITVKTGARGGIFVKSVTTSLVSESLEFLLRFQAVSLEELAEFIELLQGDIAGIAAQRATKEDIKNLKKLLAEAKVNLGKGVSHFDQLLNIDDQFHITLAEIARNRLFAAILQTVFSNMYQYHDSIIPKKEWIMKMMYEQLCGIADAIEKGQEKKASSLAKDHTRQSNELAKKYQ
jgi:DNA-binding FadR family transcriptional regulator